MGCVYVGICMFNVYSCRDDICNRKRNINLL